MSSYYQYLFEADEKDMNIKNYARDYQFDQLSLDGQLKYIDFFLKEFKIPARPRRSDSRDNKYFIEFQDENYCEFAVQKFSAVSGMPNHGNTFSTNDRSFIFDFNYDARSPLNGNGKNQWEDKEPITNMANSIRRGYGFGSRMAHKLFKPNTKLNPTFS